MKHLTSRQNPLVHRFRAVADGSDRTQMLVDGVHLVTDAHRAGVPLRVALIEHAAMDDPDIGAVATRLTQAGIELCTATAAVMAAVSPVRSSSPIVALAERPNVDGTDVYTPAPALVVCGVDVQDPGNVGAIVRVAEAAGATGAAFVGGSADPYGWKALRGSMGSAFRLPIVHTADAVALLDDARRHACRIVATLPRGGEPPAAVDITHGALVLIGGEGPGLAPALIAAADARVSIPMAPAVESLNAAVCAALLLYEARRQRGGWAVSRS